MTSSLFHPKTQILRHCVPQNDKLMRLVILNEVKNLGF